MSGSRATGAVSVLVVDDEVDIRGLIAATLEGEGYRVIEAADGRTALRLLYEQRPDLVVLDVMMPDLDGWQVLDRIRDISNVPVIMLTGLGSETERATGLRRGADDYVVKPFSPIELAARVAALLRRTVPADEGPGVYDDGFLTVDFAQRLVLAGGEPVRVTPLEFRMLQVFIDHRGHVLDRDSLLEKVWGSATAVFPEQVKLYVGYLRRRLGPRPDGRPPIETIRGFGYIYRDPADPVTSAA